MDGFFVSIIYLYSVINHMDRRLWTQEVILIQIQEDQAITKLVDEYGNKKWTIIAEKLPQYSQGFVRSGKQCRERFLVSYLDGIIIQTRLLINKAGLSKKSPLFLKHTDNQAINGKKFQNFLQEGNASLYLEPITRLKIISIQLCVEAYDDLINFQALKIVQA